MKKKKVKAVRKKSEKSYSLLAAGDTNSFLLIVAGGIFVIASLLFVFGNPFV